MRRKPRYSGCLWSSQNHARDQTQHILDLAPGFDAGRKCVFELTRHPEEHFPEDRLFACELVVERPPGHARGNGQFVHADGAEASFQEQALGRLDDGLPRPATPSLQAGLVCNIANLHASPCCTYKCIYIYCNV